MEPKIILPLILTSCTTPYTGTVPYDLTNRASMLFSVEGISYQGTAVLQRKSSQTINFSLPKNTLKLMITTCSREEFFAYPDSNKPFKYIYVPIMFLENMESCLMRVTAISDRGETTTGLIDFTAGEELESELL